VLAVVGRLDKPVWALVNMHVPGDVIMDSLHFAFDNPYLLLEELHMTR
jgi:hypothetical protein